MNRSWKTEAKRSWKATKLAILEKEYGKEAAEWDKIEPAVEDDRRVYINMYNQLVEAVKSLEDEPHAVVRVAMNHYIEDAGKTMEIIKKCF